MFKLKNIKNNKAGFVLVELMVAIFIFTIVMTISIGALIAGLDANRKTQSLKSVLNNLNVVLDTMTKSLAVGRYYQCEEATIPLQQSYGNVDCGLGDSSQENNIISFMHNDDIGDNGESDDIVMYNFNPNDGGYIERTLYLDTNDAGSHDPIGPIRMTAPEVNITEMKFFVSGATPSCLNDVNQAGVLITIKGNASSGPRSAPTEFMVQTMVSQRTPDFAPQDINDCPN